MTISLTYTKPGANRRQSSRNGALVTPAIGASTTGADGTTLIRLSYAPS